MKKHLELHSRLLANPATQRIADFLTNEGIPFASIISDNPANHPTDISTYPTVFLSLDAFEFWRYESRSGNEDLQPLKGAWLDPVSVFDETRSPELILDGGTIREKTEQEKTDYLRPKRRCALFQKLRGEAPLVEYLFLLDRIIRQQASVLKKLATNTAIPQAELDNLVLVSDEITAGAEMIYPPTVLKRMKRAGRKALSYIDRRERALDELGDDPTA